MSMYRAMQNPDTPDLPFAQSTMELATLTRINNPIHTYIPKPQGWNRPSQADLTAAKLERQYQDSLSIAKPKVSTALLALAGVLLLA